MWLSSRRSLLKFTPWHIRWSLKISHVNASLFIFFFCFFFLSFFFFPLSRFSLALLAKKMDESRSYSSFKRSLGEFTTIYKCHLKCFARNPGILFSIPIYSRLMWGRTGSIVEYLKSNDNKQELLKTLLSVGPPTVMQFSRRWWPITSPSPHPPPLAWIHERTVSTANSGANK